MSKPLIYDSLLVHYLARELDDRLRARRLRRVRFDSDARRLILEMDEERLVWELHPARGWIRMLRGDGTAAGEGWGGRRVRTQRRPRVRGVAAPPDERILEIRVDAGGPDRASRFVVELMTNQWNVLALDPGGTIVSALRTRETGDRVLRSGHAYEPPPALEPREGLQEPVSRERFSELLEDAPAHSETKRTLVRSLAWVSSLNADAILGVPRAPSESSDDAGPSGAGQDAVPATGEGGPGDGRLPSAWERYRALARRPEPSPRLLELRGGLPYPLPLPGVPGRRTASLLEAFDALADRDAPSGLAPEVRAALEERLDRVSRKARTLREEAEAAPGKAARLRHRADVLMARLHEVEPGSERVELEDFEGGTLTLELDPTLSAPENAGALYDRARKRERAAERLPGRLQDALAEKDRLESLLEAVEDGSVDAAELARWVEDVKPKEGGGGDDGERLPFRAFRSSGGLEIRVGRSGRANDSLTFHHSAPDDIWLHARDVGGAHVILRWPHRDQNPPARDLMEAAILAAVNSKARTAGTVPVDWTRRKYVRSPRNAAPGAVIPERISTVFVEPDPEVEDRLRTPDG